MLAAVGAARPWSYPVGVVNEEAWMLGTRLPGALLMVAFVAAGCGAGTGDAPGAGGAAEMTGGGDVASGGVPGLPAGYALRLDHEGANPTDFRAMIMGGGLYVQTGPAGILYHDMDAVAEGDYTVSATFTELGAPANHREAYGIFIGGQDLQGADQSYTYFLVRADGRYLIKRRTGAETADVSEGWVAHEAVNASTGSGDVVNALEVRVAGDEVRFSVNGTEVATVPAAGLDTHGIAGVRINHNLNVLINNWGVVR